LQGSSRYRIRLPSIDVFVFPALFEGLGTSLLAAMAHGVPSVTYLGCALGEIVEDGKSGLQVEPRNPEALCAAVRSVLNNSGFAAKLGAAGRHRIEEVFPQNEWWTKHCVSTGKFPVESC